MNESKKKELIEKCRKKLDKSMRGILIKAYILEILSIGVIMGFWLIREISYFPLFLGFINCLRQSYLTHMISKAARAHKMLSIPENYEIFKSELLEVIENKTSSGVKKEYVFEKNIRYVDESLKTKFEKGKEYFLCIRREKLEDRDGNIRFLTPKLIEIFEEEKTE